MSSQLVEDLLYQRMIAAKIDLEDADTYYYYTYGIDLYEAKARLEARETDHHDKPCATVEHKEEEEENHISKRRKLNNSPTRKSSRITNTNKNCSNVKKSAFKNMTSDDEDCVTDKTRSKKQKLKNSPSRNNNKNENKPSSQKMIKITKSRQKKQTISHPSSSKPTLPEEYKRGTINEPIRVIHKTLFKTDVSARHGRLSMPCSQIESFEFMRDDEMAQIREGKSMNVKLIHKEKKVDGVVVETEIAFTKWDLHKEKKQNNVNSQYVLRSGWNEIVARDELKCGDDIEVWAYRNSEDRVCLVLVVVEKAGEPSSSSPRSSRNLIKIEDQEIRNQSV